MKYSQNSISSKLQRAQRECKKSKLLVNRGSVCIIKENSVPSFFFCNMNCLLNGGNLIGRIEPRKWKKKGGGVFLF